MTDDEARTLGLRALAAKYRCFPPPSTVYWGSHRDFAGSLLRKPIGTPPWWPDFRDSASLGTLQAQCETRHGLTLGCIQTMVDEYTIVYWPPGLDAISCLDDTVGLCSASTKIGAWVAALEAAPKEDR